MLEPSGIQAGQYFTIHSITKPKYGTMKKIILLSLTIFSAFNCGAQKGLPANTDGKVYTDGKIIGAINGIASSTCSDCYTIYSDTIFQQKINFTIPVAVTGINNKMIYVMDYTVTRKEHDGSTDFIISSTGTSENYQFTFTGRSGKIDAAILKTVFASYHYQIATGDFTDLPSTLICSRNRTFVKREKAYSFDMRKSLFKENDRQACFNCPPELSVERCLELRIANKDFDWKID